MTRLRTSDGRELHLHDWSIPTPRITVSILHGYGEHAGRYEHVARAFNARGISVLAVDLRGHGRSSGVRGHVDRFEEFHHDADTLVGEAKARANGGPVAVLGHSMGALLAIDWVIAGRGKDLAGLALSSPFLGLALAVNPIKIGVGRVMSRFIPTLALPSDLHGKDVCRDPKIAELYDSDPLNNKKATARWFTETMIAIDRVHARAGELALPIFLLYGGADKVASADAADRFARALTAGGRTTERLPELFHEIFNEPKEIRDRVIDRYATWLLERADARASVLPQGESSHRTPP